MHSVTFRVTLRACQTCGCKLAWHPSSNNNRLWPSPSLDGEQCRSACFGWALMRRASTSTVWGLLCSKCGSSNSPMLSSTLSGVSGLVSVLPAPSYSSSACNHDVDKSGDPLFQPEKTEVWLTWPNSTDSVPASTRAASRALATGSPVCLHPVFIHWNLALSRLPRPLTTHFTQNIYTVFFLCVLERFWSRTECHVLYSFFNYVTLLHPDSSSTEDAWCHPSHPQDDSLNGMHCPLSTFSRSVSTCPSLGLLLINNSHHHGASEAQDR